jgi:hypothetical protein
MRNLGQDDWTIISMLDDVATGGPGHGHGLDPLAADTEAALVGSLSEEKGKAVGIGFTGFIDHGAPFVRLVSTNVTLQFQVQKIFNVTWGTFFQ